MNFRFDPGLKISSLWTKCHTFLHDRPIYFPSWLHETQKCWQTEYIRQHIWFLIQCILIRVAKEKPRVTDMCHAYDTRMARLWHACDTQNTRVRYAKYTRAIRKMHACDTQNTPFRHFRGTWLASLDNWPHCWNQTSKDTRIWYAKYTRVTRVQYAKYTRAIRKMHGWDTHNARVPHTCHTRVIRLWHSFDASVKTHCN